MVKLVHLYGSLGLNIEKFFREISRLNFINLNAYKFGQRAKHCSLLSVSRGVSVKRGPDTCAWRIRMGK